MKTVQRRAMVIINR